MEPLRLYDGTCVEPTTRSMQYPVALALVVSASCRIQSPFISRHVFSCSSKTQHCDVMWSQTSYQPMWADLTAWIGGCRHVIQGTSSSAKQVLSNTCIQYPSMSLFRWTNNACNTSSPRSAKLLRSVGGRSCPRKSELCGLVGATSSASELHDWRLVVLAFRRLVILASKRLKLLQ